MLHLIRKIAVLTGDHSVADETKRGGRYNEEDLVTHEAMRRAFMSLPDYEFKFWNDHSRLFQLLGSERPDLLVNFCDTGYRNVATLELHIPAYLELFGIPYTGAPPSAIATCYDKEIVRLVAEAHGIPTPREAYIAATADLANLPELYPALIKPNRADGSVGITKDAVVRTPAEARRYLEWMRATLPGRDALMQEYLPGPEYGVGLIGNPGIGFEKLPPLEVDFSGLPAGLNPILSYESKAMPDSPYWTDIRIKPATLDPATVARMRGWAEHLFERLGLRDYGRFDFRAAANGEVKLMEVNPNPAWANDGKLAFMAGFGGLSYPDMLSRFLETAIARITA